MALFMQQERENTSPALWVCAEYLCFEDIFGTWEEHRHRYTLLARRTVTHDVQVCVKRHDEFGLSNGECTCILQNDFEQKFRAETVHLDLDS